MSDKTQETLDLFWLVRNVKWRYKLDQYEGKAVDDLLKTIGLGMKKIEAEALKRAKPSMRAEELTQELEALSLALREQIGASVSSMVGQVGPRSAIEHAKILSCDGAIPGIDTVALSADQFRKFVAGPMSGGTSLPDWVSGAWGQAVGEEIRRELAAGALLGSGYRKMVKGIMDRGLVNLKHEAVTIARTFIQTASVAAQFAVYEKNKSVMKGWKWSSVLEPGYMATGQGTCVRCSALDGTEHKLGSGPQIPLHPRCRCIARPVTKSWKELGANAKDITDAARPYAIYGPENIDAGGKRTILEVGKHKGDYAKWWAKQSRALKLNVVGPGRLKLIEAGLVDFKDLVDKTGRLRTIKELQALGKTPKPTPVPKVPKAPKASSKKYWDPTTESGKWHESAFSKAPEWIKKVVAKIGDPPGGVKYEAYENIHFNPDGLFINMGSYKRGVGVRPLSTWRHEFGHWIDNAIMRAKGRGYAFFSEGYDFTKAMEADALIMDAGGPSLKRRKNVYNATALYGQAADKRAFFNKLAAEIGLDGDETMKAIMDRVKTDPDEFVDARDAFAHRERMAVKLVAAIKEKDARIFLYALNGERGPLTTAKNSEAGMLDYCADLCGAATKNSIGWGHDDDYYDERKGYGQQAEALANIVTICGDGSPFWRKFVETFTPNMLKEVESAFKVVAK